MVRLLDQAAPLGHALGRRKEARRFLRVIQSTTRSETTILVIRYYHHYVFCCPTEKAEEFIPAFPDLKKQFDEAALEFPEFNDYKNLNQAQLLEMFKENLGFDNFGVTALLKKLFKKKAKVPFTDIDVFDFLPAF